MVCRGRDVPRLHSFPTRGAVSLRGIVGGQEVKTTDMQSADTQGSAARDHKSNRRLRNGSKRFSQIGRKREAAILKEILGLIARGPPARSGISVEAWRSWHGRGFIICPASNGRYTCANHRCRMGADCRELRELGLRGDRSALPRRERPMWGARNRQRNPCSVRVEPGKRRCRFHGGLSTGPKTAAGRARIAEARRRRWSAFRKARNS
jgi:hypothetical protein